VSFARTLVLYAAPGSTRSERSRPQGHGQVFHHEHLAPDLSLLEGAECIAGGFGDVLGEHDVGDHAQDALDLDPEGLGLGGGGGARGGGGGMRLCLGGRGKGGWLWTTPGGSGLRGAASTDTELG
jgi:hypothetical protein